MALCNILLFSGTLIALIVLVVVLSLVIIALVVYIIVSKSKERKPGVFIMATDH